jgi:hypothetical protein
MNDIQGEIVDIIHALPNITAWRGRLPVGFKNDTKTAYVTVTDDRHHVTGATRTVQVEVRIFGGSTKLSDVRATYEAIAEALLARTSNTISITGELTGQELPPEPDTGWVSYLLRFNAMIKER